MVEVGLRLANGAQHRLPATQTLQVTSNLSQSDVRRARELTSSENMTFSRDQWQRGYD